MGDEDRAHPQVMLSSWHHNFLGGARYLCEVWDALLSAGHTFAIYRKGGEDHVEMHTESGIHKGSGRDFYAAFWAAKEELDFCREVGPGNSADPFEPDERRSIERPEK